jgi:hypothetical protein
MVAFPMEIFKIQKNLPGGRAQVPRRLLLRISQTLGKTVSARRVAQFSEIFICIASLKLPETLNEIMV